MGILELIKEGLRIARASRALWLYGFFVGLATMGTGGTKGHTLGASAAGRFSPHAFTGSTALLMALTGTLLFALIALYFVSAGALIEGVIQVRQGKLPTMRRGWSDGLAHCGVLFRISVLYLAMSVGSLVLLAAPSLLSLKLGAMPLAVMFAIPAVLIGVPWLVTLYMWQAFAARIAVIENRHARDALLKARLFLHGRLLHGLKLIIAATLGRLVVALAGAIGLGAAALAVFVVLKALGVVHLGPSPATVVLGTLALLPAAFGITAISGITQSSVWTIGYMAQQRS